MKLVKLVTLPLVLLAITGCGKKDDAPASSTVAAIGPNVTQYPGQNFMPITSYYGYFYVEYQFQENGCYTGYHRFSSYSNEETKRQLCTTLQNQWRNRGCAQAIRQAYFNQQCAGYSWNPM